jgi:GMP synthase (glutamine-hydrolysing)
MQPVLVIEQEHSLRGLGLLGDRLDASGLPYRQLRGWDERLDDLEARDFSAIVAMGGNAHAWEEGVPLLEAERDLLHDAVEEAVPVLGICLGGQLLARALGGDVREAEQPEIGWLEIAPTEEAAADPILGHLTAPTGVYQWHHDVIELPPGARRLASSPLAPNQAFRADGTDAWGIQFHPEVDAQLFETWISRHPEEVREAGVDVDALRTTVRHGIEKSHPFQVRLFDAFLGLVRGTWHA